MRKLAVLKDVAKERKKCFIRFFCGEYMCKLINNAEKAESRQENRVS